MERIEFLAVLAILNLVLLWLIKAKLSKKQLCVEISVNGHKYLYIYPEPESKGEHKGKYPTPFIDQHGQRHSKPYDLKDHKKSLLSTINKHKVIFDELLRDGKLIPSK